MRDAHTGTVYYVIQLLTRGARPGNVPGERAICLKKRNSNESGAFRPGVRSTFTVVHSKRKVGLVEPTAGVSSLNRLTTSMEIDDFCLISKTPWLSDCHRPRGVRLQSFRCARLSRATAAENRRVECGK